VGEDTTARFSGQALTTVSPCRTLQATFGRLLPVAFDMALPTPASLAFSSSEQRLHGQRVAFVGKLVGMTRAEARQAVVAEGATVVKDESTAPTLIVIGDNSSDLASAMQNDEPTSQRYAEEIAEGRATLLRESELWNRLGLVNEEPGVRRLYTPAMLAELLGVPVAAIRRWHRSGSLVACRSVRRLPYFDFADVAAARHLADLLNAGCSLAAIDRRLAELRRAMPEVSRPLCDPSIVVSGCRLFLRHGEELTEPGGQLQIDFDKPTEIGQQANSTEHLLSIASSPGATPAGTGEQSEENFSTLDQLQQEAQDWEDQGELEHAAEVYRTILVAGGPSAESHFSLADLLYRMGDLSAARERYYAAIEMDEEYVEARANLGSVLVENDELELAVAAFQGALAFHPDYADVHYHLANTLERIGRPDESPLHWQAFLALAPESPWAETARERLGGDFHKSPTVLVH